MGHKHILIMLITVPGLVCFDTHKGKTKLLGKRCLLGEQVNGTHAQGNSPWFPSVVIPESTLISHSNQTHRVIDFHNCQAGERTQQVERSEPSETDFLEQPRRQEGPGRWEHAHCSAANNRDTGPVWSHHSGGTD